VPVGSSRLELLQATDPESPIARFLARRGAGLHHITLRVEDIRAALAQLTARGIKLIDSDPRPGAEGALIAFIHPSSAQGVLIELKQPGERPIEDELESHRFALGSLELISVSDGLFRLDGGSMFGVVPKTMWSKAAKPDDRNRIQLSMRPLVVRGTRTMLIDAGVGDKENDKFYQIYGVERRVNHLEQSLAAAGLSLEDIDIVLASHLHFDHAGGFTMRDAGGRLRPKFPRAQYVVRRGEWEDAIHPNARTRASYLLDNYVPLADAGVLQLVDDDQTIMPGVRVRRTGGHTPHHQMVMIESGGKTAAFVADLIPTTAHLPDVWVMGYDLLPLESMAVKGAFVAEAIEKDILVFFEHDPTIAAGYLREENRSRTVAPAANL
jgi:glyoxylase-like metal-dependent hydrolase (beta-lactamase superfamily II)